MPNSYVLNSDIAQFVYRNVVILTDNENNVSMKYQMSNVIELLRVIQDNKNDLFFEISKIILSIIKK